MYGEPHFSGDIDEVAVYARALSPDEVLGHASLPLPDGLGDECDPCPRSIDPACVPLSCRDDDGDGYGIRGASACTGTAAEAGDPPAPAVFALFDCDDGDASRHPGATDVCDDLDNDCDGRLDEDCAGPPQVTTYRYNEFNQLLDATDPARTTTFTWDGNGNQTEKAAPEGATQYTWDARDRLSEIALPDGTTARYGYDTENLRVAMDDGDGARRILLDGLEERGEVDEATGEVTARFDHDPTRIDALLAQDTAADGRTAMFADALGSVYGLADDAAGTRARYGYDVYGARTASVEEIATRWGFQGRAWNGEASLLYSRHRYLDPGAGLWLSPDPFGFKADSNFYLEMGGNPAAFRDPVGLSHSTTIQCFNIQAKIATNVLQILARRGSVDFELTGRRAEGWEGGHVRGLGKGCSALVTNLHKLQDNCILDLPCDLGGEEWGNVFILSWSLTAGIGWSVYFQYCLNIPSLAGPFEVVAPSRTGPVPAPIPDIPPDWYFGGIEEIMVGILILQYRLLRLIPV